MKRASILLVLLVLLLSALACGTGGPITRRNNEIRRAALAYELEKRGPVDELLVAFGLTEVRGDLGFKAGNTVWLNQLAQAEYFRTRDKTQSYLFLHDLSYEGNIASIIVDRADSNGFQSHKLTLRRENNGWHVSSDEALESSSASTD